MAQQPTNNSQSCAVDLINVALLECGSREKEQNSQTQRAEREGGSFHDSNVVSPPEVIRSVVCPSSPGRSAMYCRSLCGNVLDPLVRRSGARWSAWSRFWRLAVVEALRCHSRSRARQEERLTYIPCACGRRHWAHRRKLYAMDIDACLFNSGSPLNYYSTTVPYPSGCACVRARRLVVSQRARTLPVSPLSVADI